MVYQDDLGCKLIGTLNQTGSNNKEICITLMGSPEVGRALDLAYLVILLCCPTPGSFYVSALSS